jgi:hypothetical protein
MKVVFHLGPPFAPLSIYHITKQRLEEPHTQVGQLGPRQTAIDHGLTAQSSDESRPEFTIHAKESAKQKVQ